MDLLFTRYQWDLYQDFIYFYCDDESSRVKNYNLIQYYCILHANKLLNIQKFRDKSNDSDKLCKKYNKIKETNEK